MSIFLTDIYQQVLQLPAYFLFPRAKDILEPWRVDFDMRTVHLAVLSYRDSYYSNTVTFGSYRNSVFNDGLTLVYSFQVSNFLRL